ncbi:MAG: hypothetical protein ACRD8U_05310, partial [Pyrinomonadaceae bacterium]
NKEQYYSLTHTLTTRRLPRSLTFFFKGWRNTVGGEQCPYSNQGKTTTFTEARFVGRLLLATLRTMHHEFLLC